MPNPDLNKILQSLDEVVMAQHVGLVCEKVRAKYQARKVIVTDHQELIDEATRFYQHMYSGVMNSSTVTPYWMASGFVIQILEREFSQVGGLEGANLIATKGIRGAMRTIYDALQKHLKEMLEEAYILSALRLQLDSTEWNHKVLLMEQWINSFGRNLPPTMKPKSAMELASNWEATVRHMAKTLSALRGKMTT